MTTFLPPGFTVANVSLWSGCCGVQKSVWPPYFVLPHCNTFTDVEDVKFVINYDYPNSSEDYIHRIGRTARSQKTGTAYTFFTPSNMKQAGDLVSVLREANQAINPKLIQMAEDRGGEMLCKNCSLFGFLYNLRRWGGDYLVNKKCGVTGFFPLKGIFWPFWSYAFWKN